MCLADDDFAAKVAWLKQKMRGRMYGEPSSPKARRPLSYAVNYGASLEHVKQLAQQCSFTPDECRKLWRLNIREAMLIAAILFPAPSAQEMLEWADAVKTPDMAEQASFFLFARTQDKGVFIKGLLGKKECEYAFAIACFTAGRALMNGETLQASVVDSLLSCAQSKETFSTAESRALSLFVRQLVRKKTSLDGVNALLDSLRENRTEEAQRLVFEVETEIEYGA